MVSSSNMSFLEAFVYWQLKKSYLPSLMAGLFFPPGHPITRLKVLILRAQSLRPVEPLANQF